jgi:hypothetical protein
VAAVSLVCLQGSGDDGVVGGGEDAAELAYGCAVRLGLAGCGEGFAANDVGRVYLVGLRLKVKAGRGYAWLQPNAHPLPGHVSRPGYTRRGYFDLDSLRVPGHVLVGTGVGLAFAALGGAGAHGE